MKTNRQQETKQTITAENPANQAQNPQQQTLCNSCLINTLACKEL